MKTAQAIDLFPRDSRIAAGAFWIREAVPAPAAAENESRGLAGGKDWPSGLIPLSGLSISKAQKHFSTRFYGLPLAGKILK